MHNRRNFFKVLGASLLLPQTLSAEANINHAEGFIYFGEAGKDPEEFPINVFYDAEKRNIAKQPLTTRNGTIVNAHDDIYTESEHYSLKIKDKQGNQTLYLPRISMNDSLVVDTLFGREGSSNEVKIVKNFFNNGIGFTRVMQWHSQIPRTEHNGGTIISPSVPWNNNIAEFLNGSGETEPTASGVWIYSSTYITLEMFGAGVTTNDLPSVIAATQHANKNNLKIQSSLHRVNLIGGETIVIKTDFDLNTVIFNCNDFSGKFLVERSQPKKTYVSDSRVVSNLQSSRLDAGDSVVKNWKHLTETNNSFIIITTKQDFYNYRNKARKRVEFNRCTRDGVLTSPIKYSLRDVPIKSVDVYPMETNQKKVTLNIDIGNNDANKNFVTVSSSNLEISVSVIQNSISKNSNPTFIKFSRCCHIKANLNFQWANRSTNGSGFTYNFLLSHCYDVDVEAQGEGDGWGAVGSNLCQRIVFRNSTLNRIDFHRPFIEYLKIIDCNIGDWGVLVTGIGDLYLIRPRFNLRHMHFINNSGIVRTRPDTGGFVDGDLIIENAVINADIQSSTIELLRSDSKDRIPVASSPIKYRFFRNIKIQGLSYYSDDLYQKLYIKPQTNNTLLKLPEKVVLTDCNVALHYIADFENRVFSSNSHIKQEISIANSKAELISIKNNTTDDIVCHITQVTPFDSQIVYQLNASGTYNINNSVITQLNFINTSQVKGTKNVINVNDSIIRNDADSQQLFINKKRANNIHFYNSHFYTNNLKNIDRSCLYHNCYFYEDNTLLNLKAGKVNIETFMSYNPLHDMQNLKFLFRNSRDKVISESTVRNPAVGSSIILHYVSPENAIKSGLITRVSDQIYNHTFSKNLKEIVLI